MMSLTGILEHPAIRASHLDYQQNLPCPIEGMIFMRHWYDVRSFTIQKESIYNQRGRAATSKGKTK